MRDARKIKNKFKNGKIEQFAFRYFYIRNFEIPKNEPFYIWSFQILTPTPIIFSNVANDDETLFFSTLYF